MTEIGPTAPVAELDLDAYLSRIGHRARPEPTLATLAAIHAAHLAAIPGLLAESFRLPLEPALALQALGPPSD